MYFMYEKACSDRSPMDSQGDGALDGELFHSTDSNRSKAVSLNTPRGSGLLFPWPSLNDS